MEYEQVVCKALTTKMTVAGGAKTPVISNATLAIISVYITSSFYYLPIFLVTHGWIILASKKDPYFFNCFIKYLKNKQYYHS